MSDRLKNLQEQRNKLMTDAATLARKEGITAEERTRVGAMLADVDILEADIATEERFAKFDIAQRSFIPPPRPNPGDGNSGTTDVRMVENRTKKAFKQWMVDGPSGVSPELRQYLRGANTASDQELRDLGVSTPGTGNVTMGAQFVPQLFDADLVQAQLAYGQVIDLVTVKRTATGSPTRFAYTNDTTNGLVEIPELNTIPEVDPTSTGGLSTTTVVSTGWIKVSYQELQDVSFDLPAFIKDIFGQRWYRGASAKITNGSLDGTTVQSLLAGAYASVTSASDTAVGYADFVKLYASLDPAYVANASWLMNSSSRAAVLGETDTLGRPLFIPSTAAGSLDQILGRNVVVNQYMPNIPAAALANQFPVVFGDFKQGYRFRVVNGDTGNSSGDLTIMRNDSLFMGTLEVGFVGYGRIGGNVTDAGTHPLVKLTMKAS